MIDGITVVCSICLKERSRIVQLVRYDTDSGFQMICPACGTAGVTFIDGGEIDLSDYGIETG